MAKQFRKTEEKSENLEQINAEVPESKFQDDQQVAKSTGFKVDSGKSSFIPEKKKAPGSTLKQEVAASVIKDASYGGTLSGDGMSFNGAKSSGSMGGILGAANATPVAGQARSDSRTSKKLDRNSQKLNFIPCDQVLVEWDESKPLAESADADQGFNGTYRNEFARTQKKSEAVPGALMFDRSLDLIVKDNIYFGEGQKVTQEGVRDDNDITVSATPNDRGVYAYPDAPNYQAGKTGNYMCDSLSLKFNEDGRPIYMVFNETDYDCEVDEHDANKSSAQHHILMNDAELVRETMDTKAGDEKADIWTPLARAVMQPGQLIGFLRDLEANTGNEVITAYRKACTSMSFQLNRAHKDGQDPTSPMIHALTGLGHNYVSDDVVATEQGNNIQELFTPEHYARGEAQTMIALYDSVAKYNNKADFLVQPRGLRMHLQTADNNMDPLHVSKLFAQVYDAAEVFSTIDRDYDPMGPVCMTDKANIIHRLSWHKLGSYIHSDTTYQSCDCGDMTPEDYTLIPAPMLCDIKDYNYNIYLVYPKDTGGINGHLDFDAEQNRVEPNRYYTEHGDIRMVIGTTAPTYDSSTQDLLTIAYTDITNTDLPITFCSPVRQDHTLFIRGGRINTGSKKIYAYQGGPLWYSYHDLRNVYAVQVKDFLTYGLDKFFEESMGAKYYSILSNRNRKNGQSVLGFFNYPTEIRTVHSTMFFSLWSWLLCAAMPWIIKERINSFRDILYYEKNIEYPFSNTLSPISEIKTKSYANFSYANYDTELTSNTMKPATAVTWIFPELFQQTGYYDSDVDVMMPWYSSQKEVRYNDRTQDYDWDDDASDMSFPSIRSGVRLGALDTLYGMSEKDVRLSLDKISSYKYFNPKLANTKTYKYSAVSDGQLILNISREQAEVSATPIFLPRELGFVLTAPYGSLTPNYNDEYYQTTFIGTSSFRAYYWFGENPITTSDQGEQSILNPVAINVDRSQNFTQHWYCVLASGTVPPIDHGFLLSATNAFNQRGQLLLGRSSFTPYSDVSDEGNGPIATHVNRVRSLQKVYWTRIQKLPFVISPFDLVVIDNDDTPNAVVLNDIFDFAYFFGLGGFRASDFRESVYNREKTVVNQGMLFVSDPWIEDSPLFKDGAASSGIMKSRGFEV